MKAITASGLNMIFIVLISQSIFYKVTRVSSENTLTHTHIYIYIYIYIYKSDYMIRVISANMG